MVGLAVKATDCPAQTGLGAALAVMSGCALVETLALPVMLVRQMGTVLELASTV